MTLQNPFKRPALALDPLSGVDRDLLLQAVKLLKEAEIQEAARKAKAAELEALVKAPLNYRIIQDIINSAGDHVVKVTMVDGTVLTVSPFDAYEKTRRSEAAGRDLA